MKHARSVHLVDNAPPADDKAGGESASGTQVATIEIWTDGACRGNPGPGGWGALMKSGSHVRELYGGERDTTNNRMELTAVIEALAMVKRAGHIVIHTDSQYVKLGITEWMAQWRKRGWRTAGNKPVKNQDLWQRLSDLAQAHAIDWRWVKGHAGDEGNERADALANRGVDEMLEGRGASK